MNFKFKPKVKKDREATQKELNRIKETEEMLEKEHQLPPAFQMVRNIATDHWKSLKAWLKGSQVIAPQGQPSQGAPGIAGLNPDQNARMTRLEQKMDKLIKHLGVK